MNSRTSRRFRDLFAGLPARIQRQAREAYRLFRQNHAHPGLRFKQVYADPRIYSVRVSVFPKQSQPLEWRYNELG
jgi:hypothetical protein